MRECLSCFCPKPLSGQHFGLCLPIVLFNLCAKRLSLSYNLYFAVRTQFDDARWCGFVHVGLSCCGYVIDGLFYFVGYFGKILWRGLPADVGRGRYNRFVESLAQAARKLFVGYAYADAAVVGNQVFSQVFCAGIDDCQWLFAHLYQVEGDVWNFVDAALQFGGAVDEYEHGFRVGALFDVENAAYGCLVGGVAADSPNGVGGVEYDAAAAQYVKCVSDVVVHKCR